MSPDPLGPTLAPDPYAYADGQPVSRRDPLGLSPDPPSTQGLCAMAAENAYASCRAANRPAALCQVIKDQLYEQCKKDITNATGLASCLGSIPGGAGLTSLISIIKCICKGKMQKEVLKQVQATPTPTPTPPPSPPPANACSPSRTPECEKWWEDWLKKNGGGN